MYNIEVRHRFRVYDRLFDSYSPYFSKREEALNFAATLIRLDPRYRHRVNPADLIFDGSGVSKYRFKRYEITSKGLSLEEHCYEKRCHIECDGVIMSVESLLKGLRYDWYSHKFIPYKERRQSLSYGAAVPKLLRRRGHYGRRIRYKGTLVALDSDECGEYGVRTRVRTRRDAWDLESVADMSRSWKDNVCCKKSYLKHKGHKDGWVRGKHGNVVTIRRYGAFNMAFTDIWEAFVLFDESPMRNQYMKRFRKKEKERQKLRRQERLEE